MVHMRTARATIREYDAEDLTGKARILDAAIDAFARDGARASVRTIAAKAGVSPALITHHFGTKEALKTACDTEVLRRYADLKMGGILNPMGAVTQVFGDTAAMAIMVSYIVHCFLDGGRAAQLFYGRFLAETTAVTRAAAERGIVRQEMADEIHIRYLTETLVGFLLVEYIRHPSSPEEFYARYMGDRDLLRAQIDALTFPVFTDRTVIDAYLTELDRQDAGASPRQGALTAVSATTTGSGPLPSGAASSGPHS